MYCMYCIYHYYNLYVLVHARVIVLYNICTLRSNGESTIILLLVHYVVFGRLQEYFVVFCIYVILYFCIVFCSYNFVFMVRLI